jgi:hypothetical protein
MKLPLKIHFGRSVTLLLVWIMLLACNFLLSPGFTSTPAIVLNQSTGAATLASGQAGRTATPPGELAGQATATATPTADSSSTSPGTLAISDSYPYFTKLIAVFSIAASPGKIWMGTGFGTIQVVDSQTGAFGQSISLAGRGRARQVAIRS